MVFEFRARILYTLIVKFYSLFHDVEVDNSKLILEKHGADIGNLMLLLNLFLDRINLLNGKIKSDEYPSSTILDIAIQNIQLCGNAMILFTQGYLRTTYILNRVIAEQTILSMFFDEFPDKEREYATLNYRDFFRDQKMEEIVKRIDKVGVKYKRGEGKQWYKSLFVPLYKEHSRSVHLDLDFLSNIQWDENMQISRITPMFPNEKATLATMLILYQLTLTALNAFETHFNKALPEFTAEQEEIFPRVIEIVNKLNLKLKSS